MTAREMTPEQLAEVRRISDHHAVVAPSSSADSAVGTLLDVVDALTADRDEARAEVRALRETRDAWARSWQDLREAHRVEVAAAVERDLRNLYEMADQRNVAMARAFDAEKRANEAEAKLAALVEATKGRDAAFERLAELLSPADAVLTGDVYARPESNSLVESNTILVVTQASDVNNDGTCRAQPYMRMPFDSWYSRHMLGQRLARTARGKP